MLIFWGDTLIFVDVFEQLKNDLCHFAQLLNFLWCQSFVLPTLYVHMCVGNIHLVNISHQILYWTLSIYLYIGTKWKRIQLQKEKYNHLKQNKANKGT